MSGSVHWRKTREKPQERKVVGVLECRRALRKNNRWKAGFLPRSLAKSMSQRRRYRSYPVP